MKEHARLCNNYYVIMLISVPLRLSMIHMNNIMIIYEIVVERKNVSIFIMTISLNSRLL